MPLKRSQVKKLRGLLLFNRTLFKVKAVVDLDVCN